MRYFRGISKVFSVDLPSIGAGELYKIFFNIPGAKVNDFCVVVPININLYATATWPFQFSAVGESADSVGVSFRNDYSSARDSEPL